MCKNGHELEAINKKKHKFTNNTLCKHALKVMERSKVTELSYTKLEKLKIPTYSCTMPDKRTNFKYKKPEL